MPLQALKLRPGVSRESTTLANEGGWFESDKIRFRSGLPEKIGGWVADTGTATSDALAPPAGAYWGVARSLWNWITTANSNLLGVGTSLKFYIQNSAGGYYYDVTPLRKTTSAGSTTFTATDGSATLTVAETAHGAQVGDFVTFSGAVSLGGNITAAVLNTEYRVVSVVDNDNYTITATATANSSDTGHGGTAVVAAYQIHIGANVTYAVNGFGAGGWGGYTYTATTGWGAGSTPVRDEARYWSQANYGDYLIINPKGGGLYLWINGANPSIFNRAGHLSSSSAGAYTTDIDCPSICNYVMVSDSSRFVLAFGVNELGADTQDPMLVRWSDQEDYTTWTPDATNQAGGYRLSHGSRIITAAQTRQEVLVWTDAALYSMQYLGPPYVWGTSILADNISIMGMNCTATANNVTYWMGRDKFYVYSGRLETLPCSLRQYVFSDINLDQSDQFFAGTNEGFNEVWWFYCSEDSETIDRYVIYNYLERLWYYGTMERTAWLDSQLRSYPIAAGYDGKMLYHENGVDDGSTNPPSAITAYVQSSDMDIGDGHNYGFVWRMIPDITFDGSTAAQPEVDFTLRPRQNPGAAYSTDGNTLIVSAQNYSADRTYTVQQFTEIVYTRVRGRQMAFRVESNTVGTQWQLGIPRIDLRQDGRRA